LVYWQEEVKVHVVLHGAYNVNDEGGGGEVMHAFPLSKYTGRILNLRSRKNLES
jgi:hypothetical protein